MDTCGGHCPPQFPHDPANRKMISFQIRLYRWRFPRYNGVRWTQLLLALGPLHFCRVTLEPDGKSEEEGQEEDTEIRRIPLPVANLEERLNDRPNLRRQALPRPPEVSLRSIQQQVPATIAVQPAAIAREASPPQSSSTVPSMNPATPAPTASAPHYASAQGNGVPPSKVEVPVARSSQGATAAAVPSLPQKTQAHRARHLNDADLDLLANLLCADDPQARVVNPSNGVSPPNGHTPAPPRATGARPPQNASASPNTPRPPISG